MQNSSSSQSSVLGSGGIMYINGRIVSGPLDSFTEVLIPKHVIDLDKVRTIIKELYLSETLSSSTPFLFHKGNQNVSLLLQILLYTLFNSLCPLGIWFKFSAATHKMFQFKSFVCIIWQVAKRPYLNLLAHTLAKRPKRSQATSTR